jgi:adenylate kinase family enzyme
MTLLMPRLVKDYDIAFVSTGDVLRKEIMAKSEVGKRAEEVVANGGGSFSNHRSYGRR